MATNANDPHRVVPFDDAYSDELDRAADWLKSLGVVAGVDNGSCPAPTADGDCETELILTIRCDHRVGELLPLLQGALAGNHQLAGLMQ